MLRQDTVPFPQHEDSAGRSVAAINGRSEKSVEPHRAEFGQYGAYRFGASVGDAFHWSFLASSIHFRYWPAWLGASRANARDGAEMVKSSTMILLRYW